VTVLPATDVRAVVEVELDAARAWASRNGAGLEWIPDELELRMTLSQLETNELFFFRGRFDDYQAIAPHWQCVSATWLGGDVLSDYPKPKEGLPRASIYLVHTVAGARTPVICAPFNRLAYAEHKGPHGDWGAPANWLAAPQAHVRATTIPDMLSVLQLHFLATRGRHA
jgi:hypothetical protein